MAMVNKRQYIGDGQNIKSNRIQQLINWQRLYVLVKKAVIPKEFEISKEEDVAVGLQGYCYVQTQQFGVFYPTKVAYRVFLHVNYKFFPL